jgi:hypothetical protein
VQHVLDRVLGVVGRTWPKRRAIAFQPLVDERASEVRARKACSVHGDFEWSAANVVRRWTGKRVIPQDDGSRSFMPDLGIEVRAEVSSDSARW